MLGLQTPGAYLVLYFVLEAHVSWSTWVPLLVGTAEMTVLTVLCCYYEAKIFYNKRWGKKALPQDTESVTKPLLENDNTTVQK